MIRKKTNKYLKSNHFITLNAFIVLKKWLLGFHTQITYEYNVKLINRYLLNLIHPNYDVNKFI